jgi:hypothetical protein
MKWKRLRRVVGGQPAPGTYERRKKILKALQKLSDQGSLDLRYLDETGLCLTSYVPYAWQEKDYRQGITSQPSKRLNVIGLLNRENQLDSYIFEEKITSEIVIKLLDKFCEKIDKLKNTKKIMEKWLLTCLSVPQSFCTVKSKLPVLT